MVYSVCEIKSIPSIHSLFVVSNLFLSFYSHCLPLSHVLINVCSDLIDARMDAARNKFLLASLCMSIASLSLTAMTCVSGIFGMNLQNGMESEPSLFFQVSYGSMAGSALLGIVIFVIMVLTGVITGIGPVDQDGIDSLF
jgi:hypothetical protein